MIPHGYFMANVEDLEMRFSKNLQIYPGDGTFLPLFLHGIGSSAERLVSQHLCLASLRRSFNLRRLEAGWNGGHQMSKRQTLKYPHGTAGLFQRSIS